MEQTLKIGMIGLDTSHVVAFAKLLTDSSNPHYVPGGKVVAAFPGGSPDLEVSYSRVNGFTEDLRQNFGVEMLESPQAVAERCDVILLESVDGRVHLDQYRLVAPYGKPTFIDKPFAVSSEDAREIARLSETHGTPIMSCSALRYAEGLTRALQSEEKGLITGMDCYGPLAMIPSHGFFWYGIHTAEMLYRAMGTGCVSVQVVTTENHDMVVGTWKDGRIGTIRGNRTGNSAFGAHLHREKGTQSVDVYAEDKPYYASLLERVMAFFQTRVSDIEIEETLELTRFLEAANESRLSGKAVELGQLAQPGAVK